MRKSLKIGLVLLLSALALTLSLNACSADDAAVVPPGETFTLKGGVA